MCVKQVQPLPKQALVLPRLQHKSFENTVGKGEIARNEQFLLFPRCFLPIMQNFLTFLSNLRFVVGVRVTSLLNDVTLDWIKFKTLADNKRK